jgi:palmitoyltransferase ZDHHC9/14/18
MGILCRPQGYSWLNAAGLATEDRRGVNPGFGFVDGIRMRVRGEEGEGEGEGGYVEGKRT